MSRCEHGYPDAPVLRHEPTAWNLAIFYSLKLQMHWRHPSICRISSIYMLEV